MKQWKYPYSVKNITLTSGIRLAYVDEGRGDTTLLMLHGLGSNLQAWQKNIAHLRINFRCIALDLPGYGKSDKVCDAVSMSFFSTILSDFCRALDLQNIIVLGHSMGGHLALFWALQTHDFIRSLVLFAPAGIETFTPEEHTYLRKIVHFEALQKLSEAQIVQNFEANFYKMPDDARFMIADRMLMRADEAAYAHFCRLIPRCIDAMLQEPVFEDLPHLRMPTLIFFGASDMLIPSRLLHPQKTPLDIARLAQKRIPDSYLKIFPETGHFVPWERAEETSFFIKDLITI